MKNCSYTSNESELSDSSVKSRACFRVSVCLRRYFQDHRSRCYMLVPRRRRVRWLERRIKKVFSITDAFCLSIDGHMLPSSEPLALLVPGETIQVIPLKEDSNIDYLSNGNSKRMETIYNSSCEITATNSSRGICDMTPNNPSDNDLERSSEKAVQNIHFPRREEAASPGSVSSLQNEMEVTKQSTFDDADGSIASLQQMKQQALMLLDAGTEPKRRVRRRVRRRKRPSQDLSAPSPPPPPQVPDLPPPVRPHLRFSSPSPSRPPAPSSPATLDVERNEAVTARLPRVIRPLAAD
ncbi:hypothetical protein KGM_213868 [Danaus plexippus plexippus]|uniref:Uncharacterized protein n=1 Tax=Danaus plexippus plexippus TaxID=278856 RepID=A0A212F515_DANPL|nr:hypothetical protein KGM_213868 [Danaus plexippus plexippus]